MTYDQPSTDLFDQVMARIALAEQRRFFIRRVLIVFVGAISGITSLLALIVIAPDELATSSLGTLITLLYSDTAVVATLWDSYGAALLESLPAITIAAGLALLMSLVTLVSGVHELMRNRMSGAQA